ncbi:hypothetical protein ACFQ0X_30355 [Streptomyces rectiviolaceus]|uniref:hypothetical protein n=1 Tax=Streptomyces rectiviolaceus TaxID=332591 RepID=UPI00362D9403
MKIAKAAAGVVGVGIALGAVSPAFAAPQPPAGGGTQMLDSALKTTQDLKDPLGLVGVDAASGELRGTPRLRRPRSTTRCRGRSR